MNAIHFPGSGRKAHVAVETKIVNGVVNHFVKGECNYRSDGTAAFKPNGGVDQQAIWPINQATTAVLGQGWNDEAGMPFVAVEATVHIYPNGTLAIGLCDKKPTYPQKPRRGAVRKRVVSTNRGIIRESPTDVTLRVRIEKDNMAASADNIRDLLDREVFRLLSQLPS